MVDGRAVDNNDDISFGDIDNDGYLDVVLTYIIQIDDDPNNGGNTSFSSVLQILKGGENNEFTDVTNQWTSNPLLVLSFPVTWVLVRDVDNNGMIDIVESEKVQSRSVGWSNCIRWEWNGSLLITDTDGDGIMDDVDNCPDTANSDQSDIDNDGYGDVCDDDWDDDYDEDDEDSAPATRGPSGPAPGTGPSGPAPGSGPSGPAPGTGPSGPGPSDSPPEAEEKEDTSWMVERRVDDDGTEWAQNEDETWYFREPGQTDWSVWED